MNLPWLSVLTTPRRPQYLLGTLEAIIHAGAAAFDGRLVVFVDGPLVSVPAPWACVSLTDGGPSVGTRRSLWSIFHRAATDDVPYLLYFEDDVRLAHNAIPAMQLFEVPDAFGFVSFCKTNPTVDSKPGLRMLPEGGKFWGTMAVKIPARSLARFAAAESAPPKDYAYAGDVWLGQQLQAGVVVPSIVRHIGAVSTIPGQENEGLEGRFWYRAGLDYVGDDADALAALVVCGNSTADLRQNTEPGRSPPEPAPWKPAQPWPLKGPKDD